MRHRCKVRARSAQRCAAASAPLSSNGISTFSFGACQPSSGRLTPRKTTGAPSDVLQVRLRPGAAFAGVEHLGAERRRHRAGDGPERRDGRAGSGTAARPSPYEVIDHSMPAGHDAGRASRGPSPDVARILAGDEPEGHLRVRLRRDDRLVAGVGVAAPDAVDLGSRPRPDAFEGAETLLAVRRRAAGVRQPGRLVERQLGEQRPLVVGELDDAVVEAVDGDVPVVVVQRGDQPRRARSAGCGRRRRTSPSGRRRSVRAGRAGRRPCRACRCTSSASRATTCRCRRPRPRRRRAGRAAPASSAAKFGEPDSSSPSTISLRLTAGLVRPVAARWARTPRVWKKTCPLSSAAPRACSRSPSTVGSNGGCSHRSSGVTGCTSWWP